MFIVTKIFVRFQSCIFIFSQHVQSNVSFSEAADRLGAMLRQPEESVVCEVDVVQDEEED